jgi:hypothetical protein
MSLMGSSACVLDCRFVQPTRIDHVLSRDGRLGELLLDGDCGIDSSTARAMSKGDSGDFGTLSD